MDQDEQALRQRIETAVQRGPGPNPARLAAIRARLGTQRNDRRRNLWFAVALAAALGATAAAALWVQSEWRTGKTMDKQAAPDADKIEDAMADEPSEPEIKAAPVQPEDRGEDPSDPVIFRE